MDSINNFIRSIEDMDITFFLENENLSFRGPKSRLTPELQLQLKDRKSEIIEYIKSQGDHVDGSCEGPEVDTYTISEKLSCAQQRLWFMYELNQHTGQYNIPIAFHLKGDLNVFALERAFSRVISRHESLRTTFGIEDGEPLQYISDQLEVGWFTCTNLKQNEIELSYIESTINKEARRPFDLRIGPLLRVNVLLYDEDNSFVVVVLHHIIADGYSLRILLSEISRLYRDIIIERESGLKKIQLQYRDYAVWEKRFLTSTRAKKSADFWQEYLYGINSGAEIPLDFKRPAVQSFCGEQCMYTLSETLSFGLRTFSLKNRYTQFMVMLAGLNITIYRYLGLRDIIIGTPTDGRSCTDWEDQIGFFVNTLPLRTKIDNSMTFNDVLKQIKEVTLNALEHKDFPYIKMVQDAKLRRNSNYSPLVSIVFQLYYGPNSSVEFHGLHAEQIDIENHTAKFDLLLSAIDDGKDITIIAEYNSSIYRRETILSFLSHFETLLADAICNQETSICNLKIMGPDEFHRIIDADNPIIADFPVSVPVHRLFELIAEQYPDRIALSYNNFDISYEYLDHLATALATDVYAKANDSQMVGIILQRSFELVICALSVLKAGKAFVPIDPTMPPDRVSYILDDCSAGLLITNNSLYKTLDIHAGSDALLMFDIDKFIKYQDVSMTIDLEIPSTSIAYCLYTSGSTGSPKGVSVSHLALSNYIWWAKQYYDGENSTFAFHTSLSFDLTLTSVFVPIVSGGSLRIYSEEDSEPLIEQVLRDDSVDIVKLTPTHLSLISSNINPPKRIKQLIVGGDDLTYSQAARIYDIFDGNVIIHNEYGPTEATVGCLIHEFEPGDSVSKSVPIGHPIHNTEVYILDDSLNLVPQKVVGEICISGPGLANGYHNNRSLTAESFVPNPFRPGQRIYRTGDLGFLRESDIIEYRGRRDRQKKIRGHRVELNEIELSLLEHPDIIDCTVEMRKFDDDSCAGVNISYCKQSGLPSNTPYSDLNNQGVSAIALDFEKYRLHAKEFFKESDEFYDIIMKGNKDKKRSYDCIVLLSGGKDSTYALYQVVHMGFKVLAFTLDNGYISREAMSNIKRVVDNLGVDLEIGSSSKMNEIFVDSLRRHSNVCNGCFKAIYTLSLTLAREKKIPFIVTGLSRGQLFETRLLNSYESGCTNVKAIEDNILEARKAYHHVDDAVSRNMDISVFDDDSIFDEVRILDFYRYYSVGVDDIYRFLDQYAPWVRPQDTGRSTNCLINNVGIHIHKKERGYHNYALPYAFDVLLGHKRREVTIEELNDDIDIGSVEKIIDEIGFRDDYDRICNQEERLVAYYISKEKRSPTELQEFLSNKLQDYMIPSFFMHLDKLPVGANGKLDHSLLPNPERIRPQLHQSYVAPGNQTEQKLVEIWLRLLHVDRVGVHDSFFELGGHSLLAFRLISKISDCFQINLQLNHLLSMPTVAEIAVYIHNSDCTQGENYQFPHVTPDEVNIGVPFPLTDAQGAYWVGRKGALSMGNVAIHGYLELSCNNLDINRLNQAWKKLVARHGMLRAVVHENATQQILPTVYFPPTPIIDLRGLSESAFHCILDTIRERMSHEMRPLDRWPLYDIRVIRRTDTQSLLLMSLDVLNIDESSFLILSHELGMFYQSPNLVISPLSFSFRDYVIAQKELESSPLAVQSWSYWSKRIKNLPPGPELPLVKTPMLIDNPRFFRRSCFIEREGWERVQAFAKRIDVTPSGILLAVYAEVLSRWSNSTHFTINVPVYHRLPIHEKANDIIGVFTSISLLEVDFRDGNEVFEEKAKILQKRQWQDLDHRYISGIKLMREIFKQKGMGTEAIFPVVFTNIIGLGRAGRESGLGHIGEIVYGISQTPQVSLDCQLAEDNEGLLVCWDAVEEIFPKGLLDDMFAAFEAILRSLGSGQENPNQLIDRVTVCEKDIAVRRQINLTQAPLPNVTVTELFCQQVDKNAKSLALITEEEKIPYGELFSLSMQIRTQLVEYGARTDQLVGVAMDKCWGQVAAVMGVLLSGSAYLPIDPCLPQDRVDYLLRDGNVSCVLTHSSVAERVTFNAANHIIDIEELQRNTEVIEYASHDVSLRDLAYVLYTSGTTGDPKGVMIEHQSIVNRVADVNQRFGINSSDRAIAITGLQHDLSVYDMFGLLTVGGALVIPDQRYTRNPKHWLKLIVEHGVTVWNSVPAFMEMLIAYLEAELRTDIDLPLRWIFLSGDRIHPSLPKRIKDIMPNAEVVSLGGPTEITFWDICHYPLNKVAEDERIPYGRPLQNAKYYVLDDQLRDCPNWVTGELCISGVGLARGYWNNKDATRAKFITHPSTGERLYRSGDLGRYLPDGTIDIVGRKDLQVKINGFRIECEEVESTLMRHPLLSEAIVVPYLHSTSHQYLVAYIVADKSKVNLLSSSDDSTPISDNDVQNMQFRLSQPGIRHFEDKDEFISLGNNLQHKESIDLFLLRRSSRYFVNRSIPLHKFSEFISCLGQVSITGETFPKYRYGSAGNLYPVQTYLYFKPSAVEPVSSGVYYYDPVGHHLVPLTQGIEITEELVGQANRATFTSSSFTIFLIAKSSAMTTIYGDESLRFITIETGLMAQLLETSSRDLGIGLCQIGGVDFEPVRKYFQLDEDHVVIHALLGGYIDENAIGEANIGASIVHDQYSADEDINFPITINRESDLIADVKAFVEKKLAQAAIPTKYLIIDKIPTTENGKVDRKALPDPGEILTSTVADYVAPETEIEEKLANIWKNILVIEQVGVYDNFFDLGGNSVLLVQCATKVADQFRKDFDITKMFTYPTIKSLASYLTTNEGQKNTKEEGTKRAGVRKKMRKKRNVT